MIDNKGGDNGENLDVESEMVEESDKGLENGESDSNLGFQGNDKGNKERQAKNWPNKKNGVMLSGLKSTLKVLKPNVGKLGFWGCSKIVTT